MSRKEGKSKAENYENQGSKLPYWLIFSVASCGIFFIAYQVYQWWLKNDTTPDSKNLAMVHEGHGAATLAMDIIQNMIPRNAAEDLFKNATTHEKCATLVVYESHDVPVATDFLKLLLETVGSKVVNYFAEESLGSTAKSIAHKISENLSNPKVMVICQSYLELLRVIQVNKINFVGVDVPNEYREGQSDNDRVKGTRNDQESLVLRNKFMARNIQNQCEANPGLQVFLVGAAHGLKSFRGVEWLLRRVGIETHGVYFGATDDDWVSPLVDGASKKKEYPESEYPEGEYPEGTEFYIFNQTKEGAEEVIADALRRMSDWFSGLSGEVDGHQSDV
ncbi:MAG: hypothetical protein V4485_05670 [Pseudomonadota bacterium]